MNIMREVNDQHKEMTLKKKIYLLHVPALFLCLNLAACGSSIQIPFCFWHMRTSDHLYSG